MPISGSPAAGYTKRGGAIHILSFGVSPNTFSNESTSPLASSSYLNKYHSLRPTSCSSHRSIHNVITIRSRSHHPPSTLPQPNLRDNIRPRRRPSHTPRKTIRHRRGPGQTQHRTHTLLPHPTPISITKLKTHKPRLRPRSKTRFHRLSLRTTTPHLAAATHNRIPRHGRKPAQRRAHPGRNRCRDPEPRALGPCRHAVGLHKRAIRRGERDSALTRSRRRAPLSRRDLQRG